MDRNPVAPFDGKAFGAEFAEVVKIYVERSLNPVMARLEAIERRFESLPVPQDGKDANPDIAADLAVSRLKPEIDGLRKEVEAIRIPEVPDFKTVIAETVEAAVTEKVAGIPVPQNGKDGRDGTDGKSVTIDDIAPVIHAEVAKRFAEFPAPKDGRDGRDGRDGVDGKSVSIEEVTPVIEAVVAKKVAEIPVPENGKDGTSITVSDVAGLIEETVAKQLAALPAPRDGRDGADGLSVDPAEVELMVEREVSAAVAEAIKTIPAPKDGEPGKSVTVDEITPVVLAEVKRLVSEFPVPQDGKSVTVDDVRPVIEAEVEKAVAEIPVPKDGVGLAGALIDREGNLAITLTDGSVKTLGSVIGKDGSNGRDGRDGIDGKDADFARVDEVVSLPDGLNERIAKAVRLMAETPVMEIAAAAYHAPAFAPAAKSQPDIHVHMPEIKEMKVSVEAEIPPQQITVQNQLPPPRKTRTVVEEHDARGRVKKFRQEEID